MFNDQDAHEPPTIGSGSSQFGSIAVVAEGFAVWIGAHAFGGFVVNPLLSRIVTDAPELTIQMLSTSGFSPLVAILYLHFRRPAHPRLLFTRPPIVALQAGVVAAWLVAISNIFVAGSNIPFAQEVLETQGPWRTINMAIVVGWVPLLEELLVRGLCFSILRESLGPVFATALSTALFVLFHGIWGLFSTALVFVFLYSLILTATYVEGGILSSILVHAFINSFLLYVCASNASYSHPF